MIAKPLLLTVAVFALVWPSARAAEPAAYPTIGGVDYSVNQGHLPQYELSRNLIQNPGFENGFQYWTTGWRDARMENMPVHADDYEIATERPFAGHRCAMLLGERGQTPNGLSTMAIPVTPGKLYTLSVYARADRDGMSMTSEVMGYRDGGSLYAGDTLHTDWRRYSHTFTPKSAIVNVWFIKGGPSDASSVYIDNVQLEEGQLTDYTEKPLDLVLVTSQRSSVSQVGKPVAAHWEVHGKPLTSGTATIVTRDIFGAELHKQAVAFKTDAAGDATIAQPWCETLDKGLYIQEASVQTADGFKIRQYGRLSIMSFITERTKHQTMFSTGALDRTSGSWDRRLGAYRDYGLGSSVPFGVPSADFTAKLKQYGLGGAATCLGENGEAVDASYAKSGAINLKRDFKGSDDDLAAIERFSYDHARANPDQTRWKMVNEPASPADDAETMKRLMKAYAAAYRGIKRAQPNSIVYSPDPANIQPSSGAKWLALFIECGGLKVCDEIAAHHYRPRPESPDLDMDIESLFAMLDKHGYHGNLWFTEGGGWQSVHLPAIGMNVHAALSSEGVFGDWHSGFFTYDMTLGEKIASAYTMRTWIMCLKYGDRLKQASDWLLQMRLGLDYDLKPTPEIHVLNVLNNLLGNATYAKTIPMGSKAHGYAFVNAAKQPVIALWTTDLANETGPATGPVLRLGALAKDVTIVNMVGTTIKPTNGEVKVSAYPVFLVGKPGSVDSLSAAVVKAATAAMDAEALVGYGQRTSDQQLAFSLRNTFGSPVRGTITATLGRQTAARAVEIAPGKTETVSIANPASTSGLTAMDAVMTWKPAAAGVSTRFPIRFDALSCPRAPKGIDIVSDLSTWPAGGVVSVPSHIIKFDAPQQLNAKYPDGQAWGGQADLSATLRMAYDADTLYLAFAVRDNVLSPSATVGGAWTGDGIQIYFDPWLTGHAKLGTDWPSDAQVLDVWPGASGLQVNREVAPDHQVAFLNPGVVGEIKSHFTKTADGYTVVLAIPSRQLAPLELKPGGVFNFAFLINDNDGEYRKQGLSLTAAGTEPFQRWDLWPTVVLGR
ncbi:MAG TPA: sugar-binding protein [Capsulimonadaceae bacterium]|jgi:hypothetical protein